MSKRRGEAMFATILISVLTNVVGIIVNSVLLCEFLGASPWPFTEVHRWFMSLEYAVLESWLFILLIIVAFAYVATNVFGFTRYLLKNPQDFEERDGTEYKITKSSTGEYKVESNATYSGGGLVFLWDIIVYVVGWILLTCFGIILPLFLLLFKRFRTMTIGDFYDFF